jgi:hypothetical protein
LIWHNKILTLWKFKHHTTTLLWRLGLVNTTSIFFHYLLCAVAIATVAVWYSNIETYKYVEFTQRTEVCILPNLDIRMFKILQPFLTISNDPHIVLWTSAHYCSEKRQIYITLNWRCALYISGQIKHLNMKTKVYHTWTFLPLQLTPSLCHGSDSNECLSHRHRHIWEKKITQPAKQQRCRLVNYTQNATGNLPFSLKIYLLLFCHKNQ